MKELAENDHINTDTIQKLRQMSVTDSPPAKTEEMEASAVLRTSQKETAVTDQNPSDIQVAS